jgi:hypothetical protein
MVAAYGWDEIKADGIKVGVLILILVLVFLVLTAVRACQGLFH